MKIGDNSDNEKFLSKRLRAAKQLSILVNARIYALVAYEYIKFSVHTQHTIHIDRHCIQSKGGGGGGGGE